MSAEKLMNVEMDEYNENDNDKKKRKSNLLIEGKDDNITSKRFCSEKDDINEPQETIELKRKASCVKAVKHFYKIYTKEKDVGITEFVGKHKRISGIIKQRYSDFLVNEIDKTNQIVRLTNFDIPAEIKMTVDITEVLDAKSIDDLTCLSNNKNIEEVVIQVSKHTKEERKKIHQAVQQNYSHLMSLTEERNGEKAIVITSSKNANRNLGRQNMRNYWPPERGNFTRFVLYKENMDTMEAVNMVAKFLGMKPSVLTYAGVKDRRAKTSQLVSVYRVTAEKLKKLNEKLRNIKLGNFHYHNEPIRLGDLKGNYFNIIIKDVKGNEEAINVALQSLRDRGFINYYGLQRFGTTSVSTHLIGKSLLLGKWEEAIELILKPRENENEDMSACRHYWMKTKDAAGAFNKLPRKNSIEGHLLKGLKLHKPRDFINALNNIPKNTRLMYIHSYQSYIWNKMVSRRIQKYGLNLMEGDLILEDVNETTDDTGVKYQPTIYRKAETLNKLTVANVVMPLPGHNIKYPENEIKTWYQEVLSEDGFDIDNLKQKVKAYSIGGSYRSIVVQPSDLTWSICKYNDVSDSLVLSDLEVLNNSSTSTHTTEGALTAVCLRFSLPSSSYATMALRELLEDEVLQEVTT